MIMVWYHAEEDLAPEWYPCPIEEVNQGLWTYQGRNEYHVTCHLQDIPENGAGTTNSQWARKLKKFQAKKTHEIK